MINKRFFKTKDEVEVTFELEAPGDSSAIAIVADFLDWQPEPMTKVGRTGTFKYKTRLPKDGEFQFRYLVDNQNWINDPTADYYTPNGYGDDNSIISTFQ